jgi:hypothetical protein
VLAIIASKLRVEVSNKVCNISRGTELGGKTSRETRRLAAKTAKQGRTLNLIRIKIMAIDISKAIDGLSISITCYSNPDSV